MSWTLQITSPIPKRDRLHIHPLTGQEYGSNQNKRQSSKASPPSGVWCYPCSQPLTGLKENLYHILAPPPAPHPISSTLLLPSLPCLLRSTPLPQPPRFHRADTFAHIPPSFSSEENESINSVSSPKPKSYPIYYCFLLASKKQTLTNLNKSPLH